MRLGRLIFSFETCCALLIACATTTAGLAQSNGQPSETQIIQKLLPTGKTRSLTRGIGDPKAAEERAFINTLRTRSTRSLTIEERERVAEISKDKPNIDLEINFDYDSAVVGPKAVPVLITLGRALSKDEFKGTVFLINGHTDGKGGAEYNQDLSERRAESVKALLVKEFGLPANALIAVGFGKTHLKNSADPYAGENRRVQIVNSEVK